MFNMMLKNSVIHSTALGVEFIISLIITTRDNLTLNLDGAWIVSLKNDIVYCVQRWCINYLSLSADINVLH